MLRVEKKKGLAAAIIVLLILVIDQITKIEVKTNMCLHDYYRVTDWFYIFFVENEGMAYGMTFVNKLALTLFRIVAVIVIAYYLTRKIAKNARWVFVIFVSMILAGASGNLIDCIFYGKIFSPSTAESISEFVPWGEGYGDMLYGKVVDMLHFPLISTQLPEWLPIWGGDDFLFFEPVFNFADSCITVGVVLLLLFCRKELNGLAGSKDTNEKTQEDGNLQGVENNES